MRSAFKRIVLPELDRLGFSGKSATFQRTGPDWVDLLGIQYWKYGGEFILEFARRRQRGPLRTSWGTIVPEEKLEYAHMNPLSRARLEQRGSAMGLGFRGFAFAGFGEDRRRYEDLANQVAVLLPQADLWLAKGVAGSNIHFIQ